MSNPEKKNLVQSKLKSVLLDLSGFDLDELDQSATFLELGFDSLFLIQFSQALKTNFKVKISFRQLIEKIPTPDALVDFLAEKAPDSVLPAAAPAQAPVQAAPEPASPAPATPAPVATPVAPTPAQPVPSPAFTMPAPMPMNIPAGASNDALQQVMAHQLNVMSMQLAMMTGAAPTMPMPAAIPAAPATGSDQPATPAVADQPSNGSTIVNEPESAQKEDQATKERKRFGPYKPVKRADDGGLTPKQQAHLDALMERFTKQTITSKQRAQQFRPHFADPRGIAGFRKIWKEMVYQITTVRSKGSKLWDIDGNEYIDLAMGFGLNLFGQSPDFVTKEVEEQLKLGVEIGPQSPLAGEVAKTLCEIVGQERATFCNTGSEAVMAALRLARLYSGKSRFVFFGGAYHGNFEQVLVRANVIGSKRRMSPAAPGVPETVAQNALVLDYGDPAGLDIIRAHADEIAAVLIEPVQSSKPDLQPRQFLHDLRALTEELDIAFIMDEVISGFRAAPGGAQEWFGVNADMATYGKVLGGGMPIGALAGKSKYMDGLDSGMWQYGDDSVPEADMTFFAGTFVRHPLAMAAAKAILAKVQEEGPEMQKKLTARTKALVDELNAFFEERQVPVRLLQYTSLFRFSYASDMEYIDMVYFHLLEKGIFTRGFFDNLFLSTEHSEEDVEKIKTAFKETILELQEGGFLPEPGAQQGDGLPSEELAANAAGGQNFLVETPRTDEEDAGRELPLTESQTEIWLASQLGSEASSSFNEPFYMRLSGPLQMDAFLNAIQTAVQRHEALHVRFDTDGLKQVFTDPQPLDIPQTDLSSLTEEERSTRLAEIFQHYGSTPFDLAEGPLIRMELLKLSEEDHMLMVSAHHIICDGWSWTVILGEIGKIYSATVTNTPVDLPEAGKFSAYIREELEAQSSEDAEDAYAFWVEQFETLPPVLNLPTDRPRPAFKSFKGATVRYQFDERAYKAAKQVASDEGVSLFTLVLSTFNLLLSRLAGQDDIVVSIPTAGQLMFGEHALVGHCVNLLPLRTQLDRTQSVSEFLKQTTTGVLDAYDYQECTLGGIIRRLKIPRDPSRMPLVEINFNLDRDDAGVTFHDLDISLAQTPKEAVNFDIFFNLNEMEEGFFLDLDYNAELFDEETIQRWVLHFEALLLGIANDTSAAIGTLPLTIEEEGQPSLTSFAQNIADYPKEATVATLFEQQALQSPDAVAVSFEDTTLTYKELDEYANRFAHYLASLGLGPEVLVGVHMERSAGMLVTLLGVLKAGGAYIPMDPAYPVSRISHMIEDAGLELLLTEKALLDSMDRSSLPEALEIVCLDSEWTKISKRSKKKPEIETTADNLAYVIYTSGSTGKPKGVEISHGALVNFLCSMQEAPGFDSTDTLLSVTTLSFDIAGLELFLPIISGGKVVVVSREISVDGAKLAQAIEASETTVMQATPATWRLLLDAGWNGKEDLTILCGGEAMPLALVHDLKGKCAALWNMYGPTETTIWSSIHKMDHDASMISIGAPIANTEFYILDDHLQPVPAGSIGQLYIGGDGLARGYLKRPELTAERFIAHPFSSDDSARLYNTGDLSRMLPDGTFECLGRNDSQVKVRGYRIELGEIESLLVMHTGIKEAAVIARRDEYQETNLFAYFVQNTADALNVSDLKAYLRESLPEYMVPAFFVEMDALPRTPNGKTDRNALPSVEGQRPSLEDTYQAPRTPTEQTIADVWAEVLQIEKVGILDNFFDLGGHSLQATRVIARLRDPLQYDVPLRLFFENPTIGELALAITELQASQETDDDILQMIEELEDLTEEEVAALLKNGD